MHTNGQREAVFAVARDRASRTGRSVYVWGFEDGPGGEPRFEVTGDDDIVSPGATLQAIITHVKRDPALGSCRHGMCRVGSGEEDA